MRGRLWALIAETLVRNPQAIRTVMVMVIFYFDLAPLSRRWAAAIRSRMDEMALQVALGQVA